MNGAQPIYLTAAPVMLQQVLVRQPGWSYTASQQKTMRVVSGLQIFIGCCCIVINSVMLSLHREYVGIPYDHKASGIWVGAEFVVAGSIGFSALRQTTRCMVGASAIMSTITLFTTWIIFGYAAASIAIEDRISTIYCNGNCNDVTLNGYIAADALVLILSVAAFVVCVVAAIVSFKAYGPCCSSTWQFQGPAAGQQVVVVTQHHQQAVANPHGGIPAYAYLPGQGQQATTYPYGSAPAYGYGQGQQVAINPYGAGGFMPQVQIDGDGQKQGPPPPY